MVTNHGIYNDIIHLQHLKLRDAFEHISRQRCDLVSSEISANAQTLRVSMEWCESSQHHYQQQQQQHGLFLMLQIKRRQFNSQTCTYA